MADILNNMASVHIRRDKDGIKMNIRTSQELADAFKSISRGRKEVAQGVEWWRMDLPFSDRELGWTIFAVKALDGIEIVLKLPRTKEQLRRFATEVAEWLNNFYETHLRVIDIQVNVQARLFAVPKENVSPANAPAPAVTNTAAAS